jgi:hypothetical protein
MVSADQFLMGIDLQKFSLQLTARLAKRMPKLKVRPADAGASYWVSFPLNKGTLDLGCVFEKTKHDTAVVVTVFARLESPVIRSATGNTRNMVVDILNSIAKGFSITQAPKEHDLLVKTGFLTDDPDSQGALESLVIALTVVRTQFYSTHKLFFDAADSAGRFDFDKFVGPRSSLPSWDQGAGTGFFAGDPSGIPGRFGKAIQEHVGLEGSQDSSGAYNIPIPRGNPLCLSVPRGKAMVCADQIFEECPSDEVSNRLEIFIVANQNFRVCRMGHLFLLKTEGEFIVSYHAYVHLHSDIRATDAHWLFEEAIGSGLYLKGLIKDAA